MSMISGPDRQERLEIVRELAISIGPNVVGGIILAAVKVQGAGDHGVHVDILDDDGQRDGVVSIAGPYFSASLGGLAVVMPLDEVSELIGSLSSSE